MLCALVPKACRHRAAWTSPRDRCAWPARADSLRFRAAIFATAATRSAICARVKPSGKITWKGFGGGDRRRPCGVATVVTAARSVSAGRSLSPPPTLQPQPTERARRRTSSRASARRRATARSAALGRRPCCGGISRPALVHVEIARKQVGGGACVFRSVRADRLLGEVRREALVERLDRDARSRRREPRRNARSPAPARRALRAASAAGRRRHARLRARTISAASRASPSSVAAALDDAERPRERAGRVGDGHAGSRRP